MNLNIIIHGRAGSTLISELLMQTGLFELWGDRSFANELKAFKKPETWNEGRIKQALAGRTNRTLAKLPEFAYFIELMLPYKPNIIVMERSIPERVRSLAAAGWLERACERYEEKGLNKKALAKFFCITGQLYTWEELNHQERAAMVLGWGSYRVRRHLCEYKWKLFIQFDDLVLRPHDVYAVMDSAFGFAPKHHWNMWDRTRRKKLQRNGRKKFQPENYTKPYDIEFKQDHIIAEAEVAFT